MARLVRHDAVHPWVRDVASRIAESVGPQSPVEIGEAIRTWAANVFVFIRDPADRELLHSPEAQIRQWRETGRITGDCDDAAILVGGLALAVGLRVRFIAVSFLDTRNPYAHTWAEIAPSTGTEDEWIECDVTRTFQNVPVSLISRFLVFPVV
jgi:hypothetical protein